jgi:hypothetical protein
MQWWMSAVDYQLVTQGKPFGDGGWEAFIPITFELGMLFGGVHGDHRHAALNGCRCGTTRC